MLKLVKREYDGGNYIKVIRLGNTLAKLTPKLNISVIEYLYFMKSISYLHIYDYEHFDKFIQNVKSDEYAFQKNYWLCYMNILTGHFDYVINIYREMRFDAHQDSNLTVFHTIIESIKYFENGRKNDSITELKKLDESDLTTFTKRIVSDLKSKFNNH